MFGKCDLNYVSFMISFTYVRCIYVICISSHIIKYIINAIFVVLFKYIVIWAWHIVIHVEIRIRFMYDDSVQNIQNRYNLVTNE